MVIHRYFTRALEDSQFFEAPKSVFDLFNYNTV